MKHILLFLLFLSTSLSADVCLPNLGSGNVCSAKDFVLSQALVNGPSSCIDGEIIPTPITVRVGVLPTANERYDIGFFVGNHGEPAIEGDSCTFSSLIPLESANDFDGLSGHGPYRDLGQNQCGDTLKSDATTYRDIVLNDVLCVDNDNDGKLDVKYALTWQQREDGCDPNDTSTFFPPTSSKCIADIGNLDDIDVNPKPSFSSLIVSKSADPSIMIEHDANISYTISVENNGTHALVLFDLDDDKFGNIDGNGSCSLPQFLNASETYTCSFTALVSGNAGDAHINIIKATAKDINDLNVSAEDSARVDIIAPSLPSATIGELVFNDKNADGIHTPDEGGIADVQVNLYKDDVLIGSMLTSADGHYEFRQLSAGDYTVSINTDLSPIKHMIHTAGSLPHILSLEDDEHYSLANFGFSQAHISVNKIANPNEIVSPSGLVSYSVIVKNDSALEVILTSLNDTKFGNLEHNSCDLPQTLEPSQSFTCNFSETISGAPGDTHQNTVVALAYDSDFNLLEAYDSENVAFIDSNNAAIGHFVFNDSNANGIYDIGESLYDDVSLSLSGTKNDTTSTLHGGLYSFNQLSTGAYTVEVTDTLSVLDRAVLTTANEPYSTNLAVSQIDAQANFGYTHGDMHISKEANVSTVYAPGGAVEFSVLAHNEGPIPLEVTRLIDSKFGSLKSTCNLPQTVNAYSTLACTFVKDVNGSAGDSHTNVVTLLANDSANNLYVDSDFAKVDIIASVPNKGYIGYLVYLDENNNSKKDVNESGIDGVTIDLLQSGSVIDSTTTSFGGLYKFFVDNGEYSIHVSDKGGVLGSLVLVDGVNPHENIDINTSIYTQANFGYAPPIVQPKPNISVTKTANTNTVDTSAQVSFNIEVVNHAQDVTLTRMYDSIYGDLNGVGSCTDNVFLSSGNTYSCSFTKEVQGEYGDTHHNLILVQAKDKNNQFDIAVDDWTILFKKDSHTPITSAPVLSGYGRALLILLFFLIGLRYHYKKS